jgi:hypothetical protein
MLALIYVSTIWCVAAILFVTVYEFEPNRRLALLLCIDLTQNMRRANAAIGEGNFAPHPRARRCGNRKTVDALTHPVWLRPAKGPSDRYWCIDLTQNMRRANAAIGEGNFGGGGRVKPRLLEMPAAAVAQLTTINKHVATRSHQTTNNK